MSREGDKVRDLMRLSSHARDASNVTSNPGLDFRSTKDY